MACPVSCGVDDLGNGSVGVDPKGVVAVAPCHVDAAIFTHGNPPGRFQSVSHSVAGGVDDLRNNSVRIDAQNVVAVDRRDVPAT